MRDQNTFHLGFTMAGAVSGGCYTAGVMDYIFEVLDKWEKAKKGELEGVKNEEVPQHHVKIDVMGGTSAGGMATIMATLYGLRNAINPITDDQADNVGGIRNNILYDSWVTMLDEKNKWKTLKIALTNSDLKDGKVFSLLNSDFIDQLADRAIAPALVEAEANRPHYLASDLEMIISHTMNRGIPLKVKFPNNTNDPALQDAPYHTSFEHFMMSHFKLPDGNFTDNNEYFNLDLNNALTLNRLKKTAKATGAFPVGLRYREFNNQDFSADYIKNTVTRIISRRFGEAKPEIKDSDIDWDNTTLNEYLTTSVDGGAINNEPYGEVLEILRKRTKDATNEDFVWSKNGNATDPILKHDYQKAGVVMIDPFPDIISKDHKYQHPQNLMKVGGAIIQTLWDQSKIKRKEMVEQFSNKAYMGTVFPVKHKEKNGESVGTYKYPLCSASLGAFGGFLDIRLRHHDFYLGRNNARNFLRAFLSVPYEEGKVVHPIHRDWTPKMIERFLITINGKNYLPVVPDINLILDDKKSDSEIYNYAVSDFPKLKKEDILNAYFKQTKARVRALLKIVRSYLSNSNRFLKFVLFLAPVRYFSKKISKTIFDKIEEDLQEKGFLEGSKNKLNEE
ncbi:hypothetical protein JKA74_04890 [Marivirga sp. S37H4]|uniref:PNPLA domain-containing protein n=1 Tax=Marivirga aurantiaca TaxID=2802615 RepID=A0A934WWN5_9BACT|nr:patatin-like phospholipase family protein [Marivirga aurantiaca]MBK6264364.1 hypothetical protein [Marivirga aurantiaca]